MSKTKEFLLDGREEPFVTDDAYQDYLIMQQNYEQLIEMESLQEEIHGAADNRSMLAKQKSFLSQPFDNENRDRYYGLRVGDLISPKGIDGKSKGNANVIGYGSDNNRVEIKFEDGAETDWVAEWCDIIKKVEDKNDDLPF